MTVPLQLRTFGDFLLERVHEDGTTETVYRAGKLLALLLQLTIRGEIPLRRAELADLFWGDESPDKARASLRQAIASLHRLLGESALVATRETIHLAPGAVDTDRGRFTDAVARRDVDAVMTLYRGSFLAMEPRVGAEFERWVDAERRRLRRSYLLVMEGAVSEAIQAGEVTRATALARAVRVAEPAEADGVRLLFDALGAGGRRSDARRAIEAFADQVGSAPEDLPTALVQRLERVRASGEPIVREMERSFDAAALSGLGAELTGRDTILAELIAAAERARLGTPASIILSGVSGSGKSRVLDEFEARVRLRGGRTMRVRLLPAMRSVPYSGLAEIVRALAALPGAIGVSAVTAASLVEFLPELRSEFPAAEVPTIVEADRLRRRQEALLDLTSAVAERRAISLLVDDGQYLDPQTLTVLRVLPRLRAIRLLCVVAAWTPVLDGTDGVEVLDLPPLSATAIDAMLQRVATWTGAGWEAPFVDRLAATTQGLPQSVIQLVRELLREGALRTEGGSWSTADPEGLLRRVTEGQALTIDLGPLTDTGHLLMRIIAIWGRPIPDRALREIARGLSLVATDEACDLALDGLESRGLVAGHAGLWALAHDSVGAAVRVSETPADREVVRGATVRWWVSQPNVDLPTLEHLTLLCAEGDDLPLAQVAVSVLTRNPRWWRAQRLSAARLANRLAIAAGRPAWEAPLFDAMGWFARRSRVELAWYSAAAAIGVSLLLVVTVMLWPRLRVEVEPLGDALPANRLGPLFVQPRVGVYDGFGRRLRLAGQVRVEAQVGSELTGDTIIAIEDGRAQFTKLVLTDFVLDSSGGGLTPVPQRLRFHGSGLIVGTSTLIHGMVGATSDGIRIIRASINGQELDSTLTARIPAGTPLQVELTFSYTTPATTVNYVVGAGPTWLDPRTSVIRLAGLPRPVIDAWQSVEFDVPASPSPGHHHLLILFRAEDSVDHLFSATNWAMGAPIWGDGNDIAATVTEAQVQALRRDGHFSYDLYLQSPYRTKQAQPVLSGRRINRRMWEVTQFESTPIQGAAIEIDFFQPGR